MDRYVESIFGKASFILNGNAIVNEIFKDIYLPQRAYLLDLNPKIAIDRIQEKIYSKKVSRSKINYDERLTKVRLGRNECRPNIFKKLCKKINDGTKILIIANHNGVTGYCFNKE